MVKIDHHIGENTDAPNAWRWLLVGWITAFVVGVDLFIVAPLLTSIGHDLGMPPASLTALITVFGIAYALTCPIQGYIAGRIGTDKILYLGLIGLSIANLYTALAPDLTHLLASRWIAGMSAASTTPMLYALAAERALPERRGFSMALVNSGLVLALVGGAPLALLLGQLSGWRDIFFVLSFVFIVLVPINIVTWSGERKIVSLPVIKSSFSSRLSVVVCILLCTWIWAACVYAAYTLLGTAILQELGATTFEVAVTLAVFGVGATLGGLMGGYLADRWGSRYFVRLSLAAMFICFTSAAFSYPIGGLPMLVAGFFLIALTGYGFFPALQLYASSQMPIHRKIILSYMSSMLYLGIATGSAVGAMIYSEMGFRMVLFGSSGIALVGILVSTQLSKRLD